MDLKVMRYFVSTVKAGSITRAAATLYVTQPTLTRQIHELEEELGHPLLERSRQGISLTPRGLIFYQRASELLEMATRLKDEIRGSDELAGTITMAVAETPAMSILALSMSGFIREHPFVSFDVISASRDLALPRLNAGLCDLALLILPPDPSMDFIDLRAACPWGLIVPRTHPLAVKTQITAADLRGLPLLMSKGPLSSGDLDAWLGFPASQLRIGATFNLLNNSLPMARAGMGAVLTFAGIVDPLPDDLLFIPLHPRINSGAYLAWKKARPLSDAARLFLERAREEIRARGAFVPS